MKTLFTSAQRQALQEAAQPPFGYVRVFHGTTKENLPKIKRDGLVSSRGYHVPGWYLVAEDFESAAFHAPGYETESGTSIVIEFKVPTEGKVRGDQRVKMWDGFPYLWKPTDMDWEGSKTRWWALRQPIPAEFIVGVKPAQKPKG